jgi:sulfur carrier protein ThiS
MTEKYIGLRYKAKGRDFSGTDCYGLVRLFYKEELKIDLPAFDSEYEATEEQRIQELFAQYREGWDEVTTPLHGDVVLFRVLGKVRHIGVMITPESFLHVREGSDSVVEYLSNPKWNKRVAGFFRYVENKSCLDKPLSRKVAILNAIPHPLKTERFTVAVLEGTTIASVVEQINTDHDISPDYESTFVIMINGVPITKNKWETTLVKEHDSIEYRCLPGDDAVKVFAIVALIFAPQLSAALLSSVGVASAVSVFGTATTFLAVAKGAITLTALALLRGSQRPPAEARDPGSSERQIMVSGAANRANPYGAKPVVLGKARVTPLLGAQNYLTYENERDSYLSMLLEWGFGPLSIDAASYRFGEVPLSNFTDYTLITQDRQVELSDTEKRNFDSLYGRDVDQKVLQQLLVCDGNPESYSPPGPWSECSTLQGVDRVTLAFHFPEGLRRIKVKGDSSGEVSGANVFLRVERSPDGINWYALDAFNASATVSRVVTTVLYTPDGFDNMITTETSHVVNEPIAKKDAFTLSKTYSDPDTAQLKYIRVRRETGDNTEDNPDFRYYHSAVLQLVTFTANVTPSIDPPNCKIAKTVIKIKATDQLNGNLEGFNAVVQTIAPTWNGGAWVDAPTSNPASLMLYVLTHPANPKRRTAGQINYPEFAYFYDYCASRGFEYNAVLATQRSLTEVLKDIAAAGRASPTIKDSKDTVIIDEEKSVVQHFTPHNSWGFEAVKALPVIPHGMKVQYFDEAQGYQESEIIVYNTGYDSSNASLFESISLPGVTKSALVVDAIRWQFAQGKLRPETYSLNTDIEYLICNRGDRVKVMHDVPLWGIGSGRIKERVSGTVLTLDEDFYMQSGTTYTVRIRGKTGISTVRNITPVGTTGYYSTFTLTTSTSVSEADAGDLVMFGELNQESQDLIVIGIEPSENMSAKLMFVDYGVTPTYNLFTQYADQTATSVFETQITLPPTALFQSYSLKKPEITRFVSDESVMETISKGVFRNNINVSFVNAADLPPSTAWVEAEYDISAVADAVNSKFSRAEYASGTVKIKDVIEGEEYKVRLRYVSSDGRCGLWTDYSTHTVIGKRTQPEAVQGFTATPEFSLGKINLVWTANREPDIAKYEVRTDTNFGAATGLITITEGLTCYANPPSSTGTSVTYYICAIDYNNNYSSSIANVVYTLPIVSEVSAVTHSFADDSLTSASISLSWTNPSTTFAIAYVKVEYDALSYGSKSDSVTLPADWLGDRAYTLTIVDILGHSSSGLVFNITKLPPNPLINYRSQVIDNSVMLFWTLPDRTTLPIDHVLIKKGSTWTTADDVGLIKTEFAPLFELVAGEFTYWAATVDTDNNESTPVSLTVNVNEPPDFQFFGEFNSTFTGTLSNAILEPTGVVLPVETTDTWAQHFTDNSWSTVQNQISSGNPVYIQPALSTGYYEEVFDYGTILASSKVTLSYNGFDVFGLPDVSVDIGLSADGVTYQNYLRTTAIFATVFRYIKVKITVSSPDLKALYRLNQLVVRLDTKKNYDALRINAVSTDTLGTIANFGREFIDVQSIQATPFGTTPVNTVVDFQDSVLSATYSVTSNVCTITYVSHGFIAGQKIQFGTSSGGGVGGVYMITTDTTNTFTVAMTTADTTGNCLIYPESCRVYVFDSSGTRVSRTVSLDISGY